MKKKPNKKSKPKKAPTVLHVKYNYQEALRAKQDLLASEMNSLQISKTIKAYRQLRIQELKFKARLVRQIKDLKKEINHLKTILPKVKIPEILQEHEEDEVDTIINRTDLLRDNSNIDSELQSIQAKLAALAR